MQYIDCMPWIIKYLQNFTDWLEEQEEDLQDESLAQLERLKEYGPSLGRPYVDTLYDSKLPNLKELRFFYKGDPIRILFVFDPKRQGVILLGGNKSGNNRFYKTNIPKAEKLYSEYLKNQEIENKTKTKKNKMEKRKK